MCWLKVCVKVSNSGFTDIRLEDDFFPLYVVLSFVFYPLSNPGFYLLKFFFNTFLVFATLEAFYTRLTTVVYLRLCSITLYRHIIQIMFMLSIAINRAESVSAMEIIKHNYILMCKHTLAINIMSCLLNSGLHIYKSRSIPKLMTDDAS